SSTKSGRARARSERAAVAFSASCTECPSSESISESNSRIPTSSSTTSICAMRLRGERQRDPHRRAASSFLARAVLDRHRAVVLVDDALDDREPQPGSLGFGRDVRLERTLDYRLRKAAAVVADSQPHLAARELGGYLDPRIVAPGERVLGVLQKIVDDLAQPIGVSAHQRQVLAEDRMDTR